MNEIKLNKFQLKHFKKVTRFINLQIHSPLRTPCLTEIRAQLTGERLDRASCSGRFFSSSFAGKTKGITKDLLNFYAAQKPVSRASQEGVDTSQVFRRRVMRPNPDRSAPDFAMISSSNKTLAGAIKRLRNIHEARCMDLTTSNRVFVILCTTKRLHFNPPPPC